MLRHRKSYWKTTCLVGIAALSVGGLVGFWLFRGGMVFPLFSVSADTHPLLFWLAIMMGTVAALFLGTVALGGVLCLVRDYRDTVRLDETYPACLREERL